MGFKTANNTWATVSGTVGAGDTTLNLGSGHGSRFSFLSASDYTIGTLIDTSATPHALEVVKVSYSGSGDSVTVVRAQDGTSALTISTPGAGRLELRIPRKVLNALVLDEDLQATTDIRAASVAGTGNAITATHTKPLSDIASGGAPVAGMLSIIIPASDNTIGAPTFSPDGLTSKPIYRPGLDYVAQGDLKAGRAAALLFNGSRNAWEHLNPATIGMAPYNAYASSGAVSSKNIGQHIVASGSSTTLTFDSTVTLGAGWYCYITNKSGAYWINLATTSSQLIVRPDNTTVTSMKMGFGTLLMFCDGTNLFAVPVGKHSTFRVYATPGSYTDRLSVDAQGVFTACLGAGGGGGDAYDGSGTGAGGGGSGGAMQVLVTLVSALTAPAQAVTVGAGGAANTAGGASSYGSVLTAAGGLPGVYGDASFGAGGASVGNGSVAGSTGASNVGGAGGYNQGAVWLGSQARSGPTSSPLNGNANTTPGGGGSGATALTSGGSKTGGAGGPGMVLVWEF